MKRTILTATLTLVAATLGLKINNNFFIDRSPLKNHDYCSTCGTGMQLQKRFLCQKLDFI